jgi:hypothetical protein
MDPMMTNAAAMGIGDLAGSGSETARALQVVSPLVFAEIGSGFAATNASLEQALGQCLMSALSLFGKTSSNVQAAMSNYVDADGDIADSFSSIGSGDTPGGNFPADTDDPAETDSPELADSILPGTEDVPVLAEGVLPGTEDMMGALSEGADGLAGAESSVLATLSGSGGSLLEEAGGAGSDLMSLFSRLSAQPSAVNDLWNGLTEDEQQAAIEADQDIIGSLDGIPSEVRNYVNQDDLEDLIEETKAQVEDLQNRLDDKDDDEKALICIILQRQLGGLEALQDLLQANPNAYLLALGTDPMGTGRFIVAINNPDTADNVATLVPGSHLWLSKATVYGLNGDGGYVTAAINLAAAASEKDPAQTTSVVVWANHDSPQFAATGAPSPDPEAAPALCQFQNGLYGTNVHGSSLHTTVIGNRTGSAVVTDAAKLTRGLKTDDVIALGRPGLDASTAATLGTSADSSAADGGPQVWVYSNDPGDGAPASPASGTAADTSYFSLGSQAIPDMAAVIVGNYENIYHLSRQ